MEFDSLLEDLAFLPAAAHSTLGNSHYLLGDTDLEDFLPALGNHSLEASKAVSTTRM